MTKTSIAFILIALIIHRDTYAQNFEKSEDKIAGEKYIDYKHVNVGLFIKKIISRDTSIKPQYELGLIVYRKIFFTTDFMEKWTHIVFEDKTTLSYKEPITLSYFQAGEHAFCFKHFLTDDELKIFKTKRLDYFSIANKTTDLDRWQPDNILKAFNKIIVE